MGFQLTNNFHYYHIRQIIDGKKTSQFDIYNINEESVIKFTRILAGTIAVYIYHEENNERIDMTDKLGRKERALDEFRQTIKANFQFYTKSENWHERSVFFNNLTIYEDIIKDIIKPNKHKENMYFVQRWGTDKQNEKLYYSLKKIKTFYIYEKESEYKIEEKENTGLEYEKFIGKKYENIGKNVFYNGLIKKKKDNGIDLIIEEENKITFVQCKNWKNNEHYKLNQKDLRAFIGDCYMYIYNNKVNKRYNIHFIVADEDLLTKSAEIYLKNNRKLKYKVIPFEN